jgi:hypothetical protein
MNEVTHTIYTKKKTMDIPRGGEKIVQLWMKHEVLKVK